MSKKLILLYCGALGLLLNIIIPPFQNPDEPQHFRDILAFDLGSARGPEIEERLIELMDRFDWWKRAGMGRPAELPRRFADIPFLDIPGSAVMAGQPALYHAAAGALLRLVPSDDLLTLYYICRLFSAALFCGSLLLLAAAFSRVAQGPLLTAGLGFFFILFLPQFSVVSISVNPEAAAAFCGAAFFWAAACWLRGGAGRLTPLVMPAAALAGFLIDRSSFYLVPMALLLPAFSIKRKRPARTLALLGLFLVLGLAAASWAAWLFPGTVYNGLAAAYNFVFRAPLVPAETAAPAGLSAANFLRFIDSVWLKFGWMAFPPGGAAHYAWRAAVLLACLGPALLAVRRFGRRTAGPRENRYPAWAGRLVALSAAALALQLGAILRTALALGVPPQGRYLFPVIFPLALLFVLGLENLGALFGPRAGRLLVASFLVFEAVFFVFALWGLIVPAFHLTAAAPHPGI